MRIFTTSVNNGNMLLRPQAEQEEESVESSQVRDLIDTDRSRQEVQFQNRFNHISVKSDPRE